MVAGVRLLRPVVPLGHRLRLRLPVDDLLRKGAPAQQLAPGVVLPVERDQGAGGYDREAGSARVGIVLSLAEPVGELVLGAPLVCVDRGLRRIVDALRRVVALQLPDPEHVLRRFRTDGVGEPGLGGGGGGKSKMSEPRSMMSPRRFHDAWLHEQATMDSASAAINVRICSVPAPRPRFLAATEALPRKARWRSDHGATPDR